MICLLAVISLGWGWTLDAAPITEAKVSKAVQTWVRQVTASRRPQAVIERLEPYQENGTTLGYIVHLGNTGYCLAGADSLVLPVYWYSPQGTYDPQNPETRYILEEIAARTRFLREELAKGAAVLQAHQEALDSRAAFWEALSDERVAADLRPEGDPSVELVLRLTSRWHQHSPYNDACPEIPPGSGQHAVVGCVATAMAQVMYYWRYPSDYQWDLLHDQHFDPVDDGDPEVARLCHDAGVAVDMDYNLNPPGSSADPAKIPGAMADAFGYSPDAVFEDRNVDRMINEIKWLRPLMLGGRDSADNGHRWVVFGYKLSENPTQFMMNLGWGWTPGWYSVDTVPYDYTHDQTHVTQVAPRGVVKFVGASDSGDGSPADPYKNIQEALNLAPDGRTLIFKASTVNTFSTATLTIARPLVLKGANARIQRSY
jgi:hypothetical protein